MKVKSMVKSASHTETSMDDFEYEDMSSIDIHRSFNKKPDEVAPSSDNEHISSANNSKSNKSSKESNFLDVVKSKFFISIVIVTALLVTLLCIGLVVAYEKDHDITHSIDAWKDKLSDEQAEWFDSGLDELKNALKVKINTRRAKNVVLFVGDGMGPNTVTATRIHKNAEEGLLTWEKFPHMGSLKTYCIDKLVPDSASTATALFGGVKGNYETSGLDSGVILGDCASSLNQIRHVDSIIQWAQDEGMSTGFVTTTRVMHATPAALYSHTADRRWECEATMSEAAKELGCKDIARQLIEDYPGKNINVIMGGGRQCLQSNVTGSPTDPIDTWSCVSMDGRDLIHDWKNDKENRGLPHAIVQNIGELQKLDTENTDYVLGIFANGHLMYDHERNNGSLGMPSLQQMTEAAISTLAKNPKGFILVVEGGMIDQAHHRGWAKRALSETTALDDAVECAMEMMKPQLDESLIIVTADHAHTLSINGYPKRGSDILGVAQNSKMDGIPYTTLTYATGGPDGFQVNIDEDGNVKRRDPSKEDTTSYDYIQQVAILTDENTHGGSDVAIHAIGPMAHLFHRVHEQSYVAHVISYAARIGRFRDNQLVQSFLDMLGIS